MRVILFIAGHPIAIKAVNAIRGGILLNQDNEVLCFSENIPREKGEALLAIVSDETSDAWETTLKLAEEALMQIDEIGMLHDPYTHRLRLADRYVTILDEKTYRWMHISRGGWAPFNKPTAGPGELPSHDKDIEHFFDQHAKDKDELSRAIIRATQLHTKSRTSNDHFTAFVLMYIALDAILAGDTLNTTKGDEAFNLRVLTLIDPSEHDEIRLRITQWRSARHNLIHRAGGVRNSLKDDDVYQPLTEELRLILRASLRHLCQTKLAGLTTLAEAWSQPCKTINYISLKPSDKVMAVESATRQASEILARSKSWMIESIIATSLKKPN